jgi:hypothetical protein
MMKSILNLISYLQEFSQIFPPLYLFFLCEKLFSSISKKRKSVDMWGPHHKGVDLSYRCLCPKPRCLTVRAPHHRRCPNPATGPAGKRHRAASCSKAGRCASLPSTAAPRSPFCAAAPHATPPLCAGHRVLVGVEQRHHTPFRRRVVRRL